MKTYKLYALIFALIFSCAGVKDGNTAKGPAAQEIMREDMIGTPSGLCARTLQVTLSGETLCHVESEVTSEGLNEGFRMVYEKKPITGARFTIEQLTGGKLVMTAETDAEGIASFTELAPGTYLVTQVSSDREHMVDRESREIELLPEDENTPPVTLEIENSATSADICIDAQDEARETDEIKRFGIYAGEDIRNEAGILLIPAGYLVKNLETDRQGTAQLSLPLLPGNYYILAEGKEERHDFSVLPGEGGNIVMTLTDPVGWMEHITLVYRRLARFLSS